MENLTVSAKLRQEISGRLNSCFGPCWEQLRFAVRSSGIGVEDGEQTSAAGQNETYLGVKGLDHICSSVVKCWASQFSYRSIEYKRQNGVLLNEGMGVVIQEMVSAEVSGVAFSRDPVDGYIGRVFITCNYGLGESVVSGAADPDTVVLNRTWNKHFSVREKHLGSKAIAIQMSEREGTEERVLHTSASEQFSLSDEDALRLGQLAVELEEYFDSPSDIEWAISKGTIYLLQVRPITTGYLPVNDEIIHEFDSAMKTDEEHWTTATTGEVMPGCVHPVSYSSCIKVVEMALQMIVNYKPITHRYDPIVHDSIKCLCGRFLIDRLQQKNLEPKPGKSNTAKAFDVAIFGRVLDDDDVIRQAFRRNGVPPFRAHLRFMWWLLKSLLAVKKIIRRNTDKYWDLPSPTKGAVDAKEAHRRILQRTLGLIELFSVQTMAAIASSIWSIVLFSTLSTGDKVLTAKHYHDFATLVGSGNDVVSGRLPVLLQDALGWIQSDLGLCGQLYRQFLKDHGHRCRFEYDVGRTPWNEDELSLVRILQSLVSSCTNSIESQAETRVVDSFSQLHVKFTPLRKKVVSAICHLCRAGLSNKELSKTLLIKYIDGIRHGYRHLGRLMVNEGLIPDDRLVFFLTDWEVDQLLANRSPALVKRANQRRRLHPLMEQLQFPEMVDGLFTPITVSKEITDVKGCQSFVQGYPVSKGIVSGRACVITSFEKCREIQKGDILITHSTDIAWSPYFPLLAGVVTEIGGLISHGAVVAREYGLPCVVSACDATKVFVTGDEILLNANSGIVMKK